jgi:putative oxidoreductase
MTGMTSTKHLSETAAQPHTTFGTGTRLKEIATRAEPIAYAALRIVAGGMFAFHGMQKILGWYSQFTPPVGSQLWVGGMLELLGGTLIALGLLTRPAAFLVAGTMAVAYIQFHWKGAFANGMWIPAINKGELAALYSFLFLYIAARGPGRASLASLGQSPEENATA